MNRRGYALLVLLLLLAAATASWAIFMTRSSLHWNGRAGDDTRIQALWLARSALDAGRTGRFDVATPQGPAHVEVQGTTATAELAGGRATVRRDPWEERYEAR